MNELEPAKTQWLWFGVALLAMTIIADVVSSRGNVRDLKLGRNQGPS